MYMYNCVCVCPYPIHDGPKFGFAIDLCSPQLLKLIIFKLGNNKSNTDSKTEKKKNRKQNEWEHIINKKTKW